MTVCACKCKGLTIRGEAQSKVRRELQPGQPQFASSGELWWRTVKAILWGLGLVVSCVVN